MYLLRHKKFIHLPQYFVLFSAFYLMCAWSCSSTALNQVLFSEKWQKTGSFSEVSCLPNYGISKAIFFQGCVFPLFITTTICRATNFNLPLCLTTSLCNTFSFPFTAKGKRLSHRMHWQLSDFVDNRIYRNSQKLINSNQKNTWGQNRVWKNIHFLIYYLHSLKLTVLCSQYDAYYKLWRQTDTWV